MLRSLEERLHGMEMGLQVSDEVIRAVAAAGFDPVYGARPLRRAIQSQIEDPLAERLLEGAFKAGDTVFVGVKDNTFTFNNQN